MKIYTKTGDEGQTGLFGGARVAKSDSRVRAYGDVDELNSTIGLARAVGGLEADIDTLLQRIQGELFCLGAELATAPGRELKGFEPLSDAHVEGLEKAIDETELRLQPLKTFVLPGGSVGAAQLHIARTVCRRAERSVVGSESEIRAVLLRYLNRLSDLLFTLARDANRAAGVQDVPWDPSLSGEG